MTREEAIEMCQSLKFVIFITDDEDYTDMIEEALDYKGTNARCAMCKYNENATMPVMEHVESEVRQVKCGDCKWLTEEKRSSVGYECLQPEKKAAWDEKELSRKMAGRFCYEVVARYKQKSMKACGKFEAKEDE